MFKDIFGGIVSNWAPVTVIFLLLILIFGAFLKKSEMPGLVAGLARLMTFFFLSPLLFLRKLIVEVSDAERGEDKESLASDQFLIRRHISILKGGLIVAVLAVLAAGFVSAWSMLPSRGDLRHLRELREAHADDSYSAMEIRSKRKMAVLTVASTITTVCLLVWLCGLFIEVFGLAVRVAGDIRVLRESLYAIRPPPGEPQEAPMAAYHLPPPST